MATLRTSFFVGVRKRGSRDRHRLLSPSGTTALRVHAIRFPSEAEARAHAEALASINPDLEFKSVY